MRTIGTRQPGWRALLAGVLLVAVVASACSSSDDNGSAKGGSTPTSSASKGTIKLGAIMSQTGVFAAIGAPMSNGLKAAVDLFNEKGFDGYKVDFQITDDQSNPVTGAQAVNTSIRSYKPDAILGSNFSPVILAQKPITTAAKITQLCLSPQVTDPAQFADFFCAVGPSRRGAGDVPIDFFLKKGWKSIGIIRENSPAGATYAEPVNLAAKGAGISITGTEQFNPGDSDVTTQLTKLRSSKPDVLYVQSSGTSAITAIRGISQLGWDVPVWIGYGNGNKTFAGQIKDFLPKGGAYTSTTTGVIAPSKLLPDTVNAGIATVKKRYEKVIGGTFDPLALQGFDSVYLLGTAIARSKSSNGKLTVTQALESMKPWTSPYTGQTYSYSKTNHSAVSVSFVDSQYQPDGTFKAISYQTDANTPSYSSK